ncbi:MAG: UxaA family hydrolase [Gemmatimonadales bacterium]|jgi:altronate hydrolase
MGATLLKLHPADNVAITAAPLRAGAEPWVDGHALPVYEDVPAGHKIALTDLPTGATVVKYGHPIGTVTRPVERGCWVHTHVMRTELEDVLAYRYEPVGPSPYVTDPDGTFDGYRRANGAVGTRNEVWIVNTVGCVNRSASRNSAVSGSARTWTAFTRSRIPTAAANPATTWRPRGACWPG